MNKKNNLILLTFLFITSLYSANDTIYPDSNEEHDIYYRQFYCNNEARKAITDLPEHLTTACHQMGVDPKTIHVFQEDTDPGYSAHSIGNNIILNNGFWKIDGQETQAWYFAHELSHVKHRDTERFWQLNDTLVDFQIISSLVTALALICQIGLGYIKMPALLGTLALYGSVNIVALYTYYQLIQDFELRANDEAAKAIGTDAAIAYTKESRWLRDHAQNANIYNRLQVYKDWLGFCHHGSYELQINRMKKVKQEIEQQ